MEIKFGDLSREYRELASELAPGVLSILERGWFVLGPEVESFERNFAAHCGAGHAVGVASGTDAIALALRACGVGPGDEVITVSHTAVPTVTAISMVGATPRFVDCEPATCLMQVAGLEQAITERTRAIVPVHLYGQCVDMDPLLELAARHGLPVIEDCAQCQDATYKGRSAGTMGLMGCFSFYPSKNLGCYGDGGAIITSDPELADRLRQLRNYGQKKRYVHVIKGVNSRLDEVQAAILNIKLPHVSAWNERRREIAARYNRLLEGLPVERPVERPECRHVYHLYVIRTKARARLMEKLLAAGVHTLVHYPIPVHRQEAYRDLGWAAGSLPVTERVADEVLSLPMYPQLTDEEVDYVGQVMKGSFPL